MIVRKPSPQLLCLIDQFDWLANCGKPFESPRGLDCRAAKSWETACALAQEQIWEDTELDASNETTLFLHTHFRNEYRHWNEIAEPAREFVNDRVTLRFRMAVRRQFGPPPKTIVDSMKWDIVHAVMEDAYSDLNPPAFFTKLLMLYKNGHFPCGWENGIYPEGRLIVF